MRVYRIQFRVVSISDDEQISWSTVCEMYIGATSSEAARQTFAAMFPNCSILSAELHDVS